MKPYIINSPTLLTDFLAVLSTSALVIQDLLPLVLAAVTDDLTSESDFSFSELYKQPEMPV